MANLPYVGGQNVYRHHEPESEKFAGVDCLITKLDEGWTLTQPIEDMPFSRSRRCVHVYGCHLIRRNDCIVLYVIDGPYLAHVLHERNVAWPGNSYGSFNAVLWRQRSAAS